MQEFAPSAGQTDPETRSLKIPPHSIEAEAAVLGGVLINKRCVGAGH